VNFLVSSTFYAYISINYPPKFYSSPERPGMGRKGKLEKLNCVTVRKRKITSTVMEGKRGTGEKER
jgi:hypothetical protein